MTLPWGIVGPMDQLRGGLVLGGDPLWEKAQTLISRENGKEEIRWKEHHGRKALEAQVRKLATRQKDPRLQLWVRVRLGGEKLIDLAQEQGYCDGSGVYRVVTRLEQAAEVDRKLRRELEELRKSVSIVVD